MNWLRAALTLGLAFLANVAYSQIQGLPGKGTPSGNMDAMAPPSTGKSTLSGTVINAKTHEPVKKANVMINGAASLSAITDAGGTFSFKSLPAGAYWVMANQADFTGGRRRNEMAVNVTLAEGEEKTGVEIALQPGASISGRVVDEDDRPVANCSVSATQVETKLARPGFGGSVGANTDSEGTYRIHGIAAGRYTVRAQCNQSFPAPHGFMRLNDPDIPTEGYAPVTYAGGGGTAPSGLALDAGAELSGIDFHVQRSRMFSVRAIVTGLDSSMAPSAQIVMTSKDNAEDEDVGMPARYNGRRGFYMFRNVSAGNYEVTATLIRGDKAYEGRQDVQVGNSQVAEVELRMVPGVTVSGTVVADDPNVQLEGQQFALQPLQRNYRGPFPTTVIAKDGSFEFKSILPGHFSMNGLQGGFFKSVTLGGREILPSDFEIGGEGGGVMHVSLSSRFGKVHVTADSQPAAGEQISGALIPIAGGQPMVNFTTGGGPLDMAFDSVPPGKYHLLLISAQNAWAILNDPISQKALADRMSQVTVAEAAEQRVSTSIVSREDLAKLLDSAE